MTDPQNPMLKHHLSYSLNPWKGGYRFRVLGLGLWVLGLGSLNPLKGGYIGDCRGEYYRVIKGDTRSLDFGSYTYSRPVLQSVLPTFQVLNSWVLGPSRKLCGDILAILYYALFRFPVQNEAASIFRRQNKTSMDSPTRSALDPHSLNPNLHLQSPSLPKPSQL